MTLIGVYCRSRHDFERDIVFLKELNQISQLQIIFESGHTSEKVVEKGFSCTQLEEHSYIFDSSPDFEYLLTDDFQIILKHKLAKKCFSALGRVHQRLPRVFRRVTVIFGSLLAYLYIRLIIKSKCQIVYKPRGLDLN